MLRDAESKTLLIRHLGFMKQTSANGRVLYKRYKYRFKKFILDKYILEKRNNRSYETIIHLQICINNVRPNR